MTKEDKTHQLSGSEINTHNKFKEFPHSIKEIIGKNTVEIKQDLKGKNLLYYCKYTITDIE